MPLLNLKPESRWVGLSALLLLLGCAWVIPHGDFRQMGTVPQFWLGSGIMGLGFVLSWRIQSIQARWFWGVAIATRVLLLFMYPGDDIWRYLWEGYLQNLNISPYHFAPNAAELIPYRTAWWPLINHPDVSAIYPPVTQWGFRLLAAISPHVFLFKAAFALADLAICGLLSRRFGYAQTLLYAWNPLVLYSFAGGGHYDSWFLLPLVAAWLVFEKVERSQAKSAQNPPQLQKPQSSEQPHWGEGLGVQPRKTIKVDARVLFSAYLLGISIAVKWISLPILAFVLWRFLPWASRAQKLMKSPWLQTIVFASICAFLPLLFTALPFCQVDSCPLIPVGSGFVSHGRSADVVPHLVQLIWPPSRYENWLYAFPLGLSVLWLLGRSRHFLQFTEWYFGLLLFLSPVIHAWYFTWLIPFSVASRNWGTRLVSLSAFLYFVLQQRIALGGHWLLTPQERVMLWLPFLGGWLWTNWQETNRQEINRQNLTRANSIHEA